MTLLFRTLDFEAAPDEAAALVEFWRDAGPAGWFGKDPAFDRLFRDRFLAAHEAALRGELEVWTATPEGALALVILLDQFPRNAFRGTPRMYASDGFARMVATAALRAGQDRRTAPELAVFFYLPFAHSEDLSDQDRCVALTARLGEPHAGNARRHRAVVARFGRFPHRNGILGRETRPEERAFLDAGGYAG